MKIIHWGLELEIEDEPISVDLENKTALYAVKDGPHKWLAWLHHRRNHGG